MKYQVKFEVEIDQEHWEQERKALNQIILKCMKELGKEGIDTLTHIVDAIERVEE